MIIRPSFPVLGGAAVGLVAGAAVYGAVSTASAAAPTSVKPPKSVAAAPALAARCAEGQKLEDGVCIVHVVKTVVVPAPLVARAAAPTTARVSGIATDTDREGGLPSSSDDATEVGEQDADDAREGATEEATEEATENEANERGSELSGRDRDAGAELSDDDSSDAPRP